jgi:hypothetical protein
LFRTRSPVGPVGPVWPVNVNINVVVVIAVVVRAAETNPVIDADA